MKKVMLFITALVVMLIPCFTAGAYQTSGSITVVMINKANKQPVSDSKVIAVKVADCTNTESDFVFSLDSAYGTGVDLNSSEAAQELYPSAKRSGAGISAKSDKSGKVLFEGCELGAYLIYSADDTFTPFLAFVPMVTDDGINFNITAEPKIDIPEEETTQSHTEQTTTSKTKTDGSKKTSPKKLPKTGMVQLPIPILGLCGVLMFSRGFVLYAKGKKEE